MRVNRQTAGLDALREGGGKWKRGGGGRTLEKKTPEGRGVAWRRARRRGRGDGSPAWTGCGGLDSTPSPNTEPYTVHTSAAVQGPSLTSTVVTST